MLFFVILSLTDLRIFTIIKVYQILNCRNMLGEYTDYKLGGLLMKCPFCGNDNTKVLITDHLTRTIPSAEEGNVMNVIEDLLHMKRWKQFLLL